MDPAIWIAGISIVTAGLTIAIGSLGPAFAEGRGDGLLRIRLINLGINPLKKGDVFVTSGAGGFYRPGVAVAIVHEVTDDGATARLIADPSGTDFVAIDPIFQAETVRAASSRPDAAMPEDVGGDAP